MEFLGRNFYLGSLLGIRLFANISLPIFLIITLVMNLGGDPITALAFYILVIGFVLMHELAHSLTARAFGTRADKIVLYIFGGMASVGSIFNKWKYIAMLLAGPASNLAMAFVLSFAYQHFGGHWLRQCIIINVVMGLFNLIPAYPLDGGRVLCTLLNMTPLMTRTVNKIVFWCTTACCIGLVMYFGSSMNVVMISILIWFMMYSQYRTGRLG